MPDRPEAILILTTAGDDEQAHKIAAHLVENRLAACVNIIPHIQSVYQWEGKLVREEESLLLCKTRPERFEEVRAAIRELHTYEVPEVISFDVPHGDEAYLSWLREWTEKAGA